MFNEDYYCVLSGLSPKVAGTDEGDELSDLPNGWIKITFQRRIENPDWLLIQDIKAESMVQMLAQIPEDQHESVKKAIQLQIDAQYVALEDKIGQYILAEETKYISDPAFSEPIFKECQPLFETFELDFEDLGIETSTTESNEDTKVESSEGDKSET